MAQLLTIHKQSLLPTTSQQLLLPNGHQILRVGVQNDLIHIWYLFIPNSPQAKFIFYIRGTGEEFPDLNNVKHIGSVEQGPFIWHIFKDLQWLSY